MTLVGIFKHILDGYDFNNDNINNLIEKAEISISAVIDKTLDILK